MCWIKFRPCYRRKFQKHHYLQAEYLVCISPKEKQLNRIFIKIWPHKAISLPTHIIIIFNYIENGIWGYETRDIDSNFDLPKTLKDFFSRWYITGNLSKYITSLSNNKYLFYNFYHLAPKDVICLTNIKYFCYKLTSFIVFHFVAVLRRKISPIVSCIMKVLRK